MSYSKGAFYFTEVGRAFVCVHEPAMKPILSTNGKIGLEMGRNAPNACFPVCLPA